jgi:tartrate dehydrogenase/decarboxylase/D-malate dehydrogenase
MMPDDWREQLQGFDAIYFGAVGWPDTVPDHISLWGSLLKFRREFDQYVNLRPVRLFPGVPCPLAGKKPAISTFTWCAKTPKANTPRSAGAPTKAPSMSGDSGVGLYPPRRRPDPALRLRAGAKPPA